MFNMLFKQPVIIFVRPHLGSRFPCDIFLIFQNIRHILGQTLNGCKILTEAAKDLSSSIWAGYSCGIHHWGIYAMINSNLSHTLSIHS